MVISFFSINTIGKATLLRNYIWSFETSHIRSFSKDLSKHMLGSSLG